jgi:flavodoxin
MEEHFMSRIVIYYFSGTGNSLAVARDVAAGLHADLIPVASVMSRDRIETDAEVLGFVFPLYDFKPPKMLE